jgi:hypothetical protein
MAGPLDPEMLLRQAGLLPQRQVAPSGGPLAALASVAPLQRGGLPPTVTDEQAYNASIQAKLNAAAEAARARTAPNESNVVDRLGAAAAKIYDPIASVAAGPLGLLTSQFPQHEAAAAGPVTSGAGGELQTAREYLAQAGEQASTGVRQGPSGGGGGGGAPRPKEVDLLTPTQRKEYERGMAMQRDAATQGAERVGQQLQVQEAAAHDYERNLQAEEAGRARAEQTRADELRFREQDYRDAVDQAAKFRIDPTRSSRGGAWFADAMGVLLTGLAGKPELALDQIDKRIARDVDAQRAEYQALRDKAGGAQNAYGMAMQRFGDARAAEKVARDALAQQYGAQMQRAAIGMKSVDAENAAQKMMADIQSKYAADTLQFLKATPTGGGAPALKLPDLDEKSLVTGPDGKSYYVTEGEKTRAKMGAISDITANLDEAIKLRASASPLDMINPYSAVRQRLESLQADTATKRTVYSGQGAMSKGDQEVADKAIGAMTGLLGGNTETLKATRNQLGAEAQRALVSQNAMPVQVVTMLNPKTGIPERKVIPSGQTYSGPAAKPGMPGSFTPSGAGGKK